MDVEIWHNPRCSKSRQTLALLHERGLEPRIVRYLDAPPSRARLVEVLEMLGVRPLDLVRRKEAAFAEARLSDDSPDDAVLDAMIASPRLIERPIVIVGDRAAIGRPPEQVLALL